MESEITTRDVENSVKRLSKLCRLSSSVLTFLTVVAILPFCFFPLTLTGALFSIGPISYSGSLVAFIMLATQSLLLAISLWFLRQVFCDIARGLPFSTDQTARFFKVGILLLLYTFIELIPYDIANLHFSMGSITLGIELAKCQPPLINLGTLLCSITFLTISAVFRYGHLLQSISDDTI